MVLTAPDGTDLRDSLAWMQERRRLRPRPCGHLRLVQPRRLAASAADASVQGGSGSGDERSESGRKAPAGWGRNVGPDISESGPIIPVVHTHR